MMKPNANTQSQNFQNPGLPDPPADDTANNGTVITQIVSNEDDGNTLAATRSRNSNDQGRKRKVSAVSENDDDEDTKSIVKLTCL